MSKRYPGGIIRKTPQTPSQTSAQGIWDMASVTQAVKENTWPIAGVPDPLSRSLRFRASASAYLNRTPASAGNQKTWTFSFWVKRGILSSFQYLYGVGGGSNDSTIAFYSDDSLAMYLNDGAGTTGLRTTQVFRDPSAWYHVVINLDTTQATASNRMKMYINGTQVTAFQVASYPNQNTDWQVNTNAYAATIGRGRGGSYSDCYMTEYNFIDGQALTPSSFGNTNDQTGVWQPIAYTGTYGTNGFYLPFSNTASTATLGNDFSGNSNNWTTNNISLTSGTTYDSMVDVPTQWIPYNTAGDTGALWRGNYCVLNPLAKDSDVTISNGNLNFDCTSSGLGGVIGTIAVSSGKWYWEVVTTSGIGGAAVGIAKLPLTAYDANQTGTYLYLTGGNKRLSPSTDSAYGASWTTNDVIGVALDMDAGTVTFYKNNTSQGTAFSSLSGDFTAWVQDGSNGEATVLNINFGQRPFAYTPPSGFLTLNTRNLPTPTIGATASTQANKYFDVNLYTGTGATLNITGLGFQPDFVWIKQRSGTQSHCLYDAVRGATKQLNSNNTGAEGTYAGVSSFNSDGYTIGTADNNTNGATYVGWDWKANGAGSSNTAGSITSTVSANTTAGFSIVTFTGNSTAGATIGHGLGVAPTMAFVKSRSNSYNWCVYAKAANSGNGQNGGFYLNLTDAWFSDSGFWNNTTASSTVLTLGSGFAVNNSGSTYVAYCFAPVAGYSAFGSYTGNGSTDGPFVFCGFRPRFIMFKNASSAGTVWIIFDTARNTYNFADSQLRPNASDAENSAGASFSFDILSNGFKVRSSDSNFNGSGNTMIYAAFAESPFKFALAR